MSITSIAQWRRERSSAPASVEGALGDVVDLLFATGAEGAAIGEWDGAGEPTLFAAAGDVAGPLGRADVLAFFSRLTRDVSAAPRVTTVGRDPRVICCGRSIVPGRILFSALCGDVADEPAASRLLERLVASFDPPPRAPEAPSPPPLRLPEGTVPAVSPCMHALYSAVARAASGRTPVLITGETGAGKEHIARALHLTSPRSADGPFVAVNCAALPAELLEAEMFGIREGIATGVRSRPGRFLEAAGGTLFLDEIAEMPLPLQAKLLRAFDGGVICPVGGSPVASDARVIAATNAELPRRVEQGAFRADLYFRIAALTLEVPPLRRRQGDVALLGHHFLVRGCQAAGRAPVGLSLGALRQLAAYAWPGNVRELAQEMGRVAMLGELPAVVSGELLEPAIRKARPIAEGRGIEAALELAPRVEALERELIAEALRRTGGSSRAAAKLLGVSRNGLAMKVQRLGLGG